MAGRYRRPTTAAGRRRREEQRAEKLQALHSRLGEQVEALRSGADWQAWLDVAARFHTYSWRNTMLIAAQRPGATRVAGYEAWQSLGRQVGKGERGIQILAPVIRRPRRDDDAQTIDDGQTIDDADHRGGEDPRPRVSGFRVAYVWDVEQTSGDPLPEQPRPSLLGGQAPAGLWDRLAAQVQARGFTVDRGDCGQANGYTRFDTRVVRVRAELDDAQAVKTLAHELAHVILHDPGQVHADDTRACRGRVEVEGESVAYLVATSQGLASDAYSFPYVAHWADRVDAASLRDVLEQTAQRVQTTAHTILDALDQQPEPADKLAAAAARSATAARRAADLRAGAEATRTSTSSPPALEVPRARLVAAHREAVRFYRDQLAAPAAGQIRGYLHDRGLAHVLDKHSRFTVGWAPDRWTALTDHLRRHGFTDQELLAAGLAITTRRDTVVDRFRGRLMLPILDPTDREPIGFIGRAAPGTQAETAAKYLNSPQTSIYTKSTFLFGIAEQADRLARGRAVIVEGPLDVLAADAAHQPGDDLPAAVSPCGLALTDTHVRQLAEHTDPDRGVLVAFDADPAGRQAAARSWPPLRQVPGPVQLVDLPRHTDPADLLRSDGAAALRAVLAGGSARPLADLHVDAQLDGWQHLLDHIEHRFAALHSIAPTLAELPAHDVGRQVGRVADRLDLDHSTVTAALVDAATAGDEAPGRVARRELRDDLDRGQGADGQRSAATLSAAGYPRTIQAGEAAIIERQGLVLSPPADPREPRRVRH
jgi:DNA primase catalytic core